LFGGVGFATFGLGEADVQALVDAVAIAEQPIFCGGFGFQEIKGVGEELGGFAEAAAVEFTLDAGFGGGVEGQAHGESISLWGRREFPILPNPEDPDCGNLYRNLKFPEAVYEHIGQYQEEKIRAGE
jgi:hypothetical protein